MNITKHDLSYDHAKLDFEALVSTACYAFVELKHAQQVLLNRMDFALSQGRTKEAATYAKQLLNGHTMTPSTYQRVYEASHEMACQIILTPGRV